MKKIILLALLFSAGLYAYAQKMKLEEKKTIERNLNFEQKGGNPLLILKNVSGNLSIEGYEGETIVLEARQILKAQDEEAMRYAHENVKLVSRTEGDLILIYPEDPDVKAELRGRRLHYHINRHDAYYDFHYDIRLRVPNDISLEASTINNGGVMVKNIEAESIVLHNVNGGINAEQVSGLNTARTVNGPIDIRYLQSPDKDAEYHTVNGDIRVSFPDEIKANVRFKSMHGDLYTNYENIEYQPEVQASTEKGSKKIYRLDKSTTLKINGGGPLLDFNVLNGNVYVKKY